jgi:hypothetical protein
MDVHVYTFKFKWVRHNPGGLYSGRDSISLNAFNTDEAWEKSKQRAQRHVAQKMSFTPSEVEIKEINLVGVL